MKTSNKLIVFVTVALTSLLFSECTLKEDLAKLQSSVGDLKLSIGTPEFKTGVHIDFIDAKTNAYITGVADVKVSGKDASIIYNNLGQAMNLKHQTMNGMLSLIVDPHKINAATIASNPVQFDITTSLAGYADVTRSVTLREYKTQNIVIPLIKLDAAPVGVTVTDNSSFTTSSQSGAVQTANVETINGGAQTVEVQQNVVLQDASGNPVTGTIQSQIIFYDPTSSAAQNAIPGGTNVTAKLQDGTTQDIKMESAGMFSISLKAGDVDVKTFTNGGLKIRTIVSPTLINAKTRLAVKVGDDIALWSKQEATGNWVFEKTDYIKSENGVLVLEETLTHLSDWNWAWPESTIVDGPKIVWVGDTIGESVKISFGTNSITTFAKPNGTNDGDGVYQLHDFPVLTGYQTITFEFTSPMDVSTFTPSSYEINSGNQTSPFSVTINNNPNVLDLNLTLSASVPSTGTVTTSISPSFILNIKPKSSTDPYTGIPFKNGVGDLNLNLGTEYSLNISIGKMNLNGTIIIEEVGSKLNVTATYGLDSTPFYYSVDKPSSGNKIKAAFDIPITQEQMNLLNPPS